MSATDTQQREAAPAPPRPLWPVVVPPGCGTASSWAKVIADVDRSGATGFAIEGYWLRRSYTYRLPEGALVVTCDQDENTATLTTLWQVDGDAPDGLAKLKTWTVKQRRIGSRAITGIANLVTKAVGRKRAPAPRARAWWNLDPVDAPPRTNTHWKWCTKCRRDVAPGRGITTGVGPGSWTVHRGSCPAQPNLYPGWCGDCGGWVHPHQGWVLRDANGTLLDPRPVVTGPGHEVAARTRIRHDQCPDVPSDRPIRPGHCHRCWQYIADPADGTLMVVEPGLPRVPIHAGPCPTHRYGRPDAPVWTVHEQDAAPDWWERRRRRPAWTYDLPPGTVARVRLHPGPGHTYEGQVPAPPAPGAREVIGVVLATVEHRRWKDTGLWREPYRVLTTVWRPATLEEARPLIQRARRRSLMGTITRKVREWFAVIPGAPVPGALAPDEMAMRSVDLRGLREVALPAGIAHPRTRLLVSEDREQMWTVAYNSGSLDDWTLSNHGGYLATAHEAAPSRRRLIDQLDALEQDLPPPR